MLKNKKLFPMLQISNKWEWFLKSGSSSSSAFQNFDTLFGCVKQTVLSLLFATVYSNSWFIRIILRIASDVSQRLREEVKNNTTAYYGQAFVSSSNVDPWPGECLYDWQPSGMVLEIFCLQKKQKCCSKNLSLEKKTISVCWKSIFHRKK